MHIPLWNRASTCGNTSVFILTLRMNGTIAHIPCSILMLNKTKNFYMSLKEEDRRIIVEMEIEKAERIFAEQEALCKAGL